MGKLRLRGMPKDTQLKEYQSQDLNPGPLIARPVPSFTKASTEAGGPSSLEVKDEKHNQNRAMGWPHHARQPSLFLGHPQSNSYVEVNCKKSRGPIFK